MLGSLISLVILKVFRILWFNLLQVYGLLVFRRRVGVHGWFTVAYPENVTVGKDFGINHGVFILAAGKVIIGDNVVISARAMIIDAGLDIQGFCFHYKPCHIYSPIVIEDSAWIGAGAIILPGVRIGEKSVVAAGSVVTKSVPARTLVAGIPAVAVRDLGKI